jgi:hypothetical protein
MSQFDRSRHRILFLTTDASLVQRQFGGEDVISPPTALRDDI